MITGAVIGFVTTPIVVALAHMLQQSRTRLRLVGWALVTTACVTASAVAATIEPLVAAAVFTVVFLVVITAGVVDSAEQRLPNHLTIGAGAAALISLTIISSVSGTGNPWRALAGGVIFGAWILIGALTVRDGYGLGDVKLAVTVGILLGWASWTALAAAILIAQIAIVGLLLCARLRGRQRAALGPAFVAGTIGALFLA